MKELIDIVSAKDEAVATPMLSLIGMYEGLAHATRWHRLSVV
jgi:hypothetical protein